MIYGTIVKVGVVLSAIAVGTGIWMSFDFPRLATNRDIEEILTRVDGVNASELDTKIIVLEEKVDNLAIRRGKFDGVPQTDSIAEQTQRLKRQQYRFQRQLDSAVKKREKLK